MATNKPAYFGYYSIAFSWLTPATAEVASHANISWVGTGLADVPVLLTSLEFARRRDLRPDGGGPTFSGCLATA